MQNKSRILLYLLYIRHYSGFNGFLYILMNNIHFQNMKRKIKRMPTTILNLCIWCAIPVIWTKNSFFLHINRLVYAMHAICYVLDIICIVSWTTKTQSNCNLSNTWCMTKTYKCEYIDVDIYIWTNWIKM